MTIAATREALDEANAGAADAAREEKHDRLARTAHEKSGRSTGAAKGEVQGGSTAVVVDRWHRFDVEVWLTNFNSVEFGLYKNSRNRAKSRQFSSDMDIFAEVVEDGKRTGLLGYREDLWRKSTGMDKRLVFKLFSENLTWHATMDLMLGRSLQMTMGARGLPIQCFALNTGDHNQMVYLERSGAKYPLLPENFAFFLLEDGVPQFYRIKSNLVNLLGDYTLFDEHDQAIGSITGKLLSLGGHWKGRILQHKADKRLIMVMKLFAGMIYFNKSVRTHVANTAAQIKSGRLQPKLERQEADLYMNPRRMR